MIFNESTERHNKKNWVKNNLLKNNFRIIDFEGYTIKNNAVTGLFDRRCFTGIDFHSMTTEELQKIIESQEPYLRQKILFADKIGVYYRYIFYNYELQEIYVYRFENNKLKFMIRYDDFCAFIRETGKIRDMAMLSPLQESGMPKLDLYFRNECKYPWMGNLDGVFLNNEGESKLFVEFQTTIKQSVANHCNNQWFAPKGNRKGDEQRWKVLDLIAKQAKLDFIIVVWSPNEIDGDIKYKLIDKIEYSNNLNSNKPGLYYKEKEIFTFEQLQNKLTQLLQ